MNGNESQKIGEAICNSVRLISKVGSEIDALFQIIISEFEKAIADGSLGDDIKIIEPWDSTYYRDDYGWVTYHYQFWLGISLRNRRATVDRYLYITVSLDPIKSYDGFIVGNQPLVTVSLWDEAFDEAESLCLQSQILMNYAPDAESWNEQAWEYFLFLTSINSVDDIKSKIIDPVANLMKTNMKTSDPGQACLSSINGIVHFEEKQIDGNAVYVVIE
jgi:hypothetical protein